MHAATDPEPADPSLSMGVPRRAPAGARAPQLPRYSISLFWRTFFLLSILLLGSALGWYQLFRTMEYEPRALDNAHQIASLVKLSRAALSNSDAIARVSLLKTLSQQENIHILPREPGDHYELFSRTHLERSVTHTLVVQLGPQTVVAREVNGKRGLWVGFSIDRDAYWLLMDRSRLDEPLDSPTWLLWLAALIMLSLIGAAALARLINRPLQNLSNAAAHVRNGDYRLARLDERAHSTEIREVNIGFNRMAEQLAKIEHERAEMLAGISHDLRTPLARLRLESELSVTDAEARANMVEDINQVDAIISKFMDYARPDRVRLERIPLAAIVDACIRPFASYADMEIQTQIRRDLWVCADEIELSRVLSNLLENAHRYGASPEDGKVRVEIRAAPGRDRTVVLRISDQGQGVTDEQLAQLTRPFFRGDAARTAATGAGLGLAIVAKMIENMNGTLQFLPDRTRGGLAIIIRLRRAPPELRHEKHGPRALPQSESS
ncbi:MAG: ATP-binding protein [Ottowia sp.]|nr:ATP-binding protein [Ottowia sp.]